jgi:hypothetical protein
MRGESKSDDLNKMSIVSQFQWELLRDHVTKSSRISKQRFSRFNPIDAMQRSKFSPEQKQQLLTNLNIEGTLALTLQLPSFFAS